MTKTITHEGVEYRKVKRKAEVGELVEVFGHTSHWANGIHVVDAVFNGGEHDGHIDYGDYGRRASGYVVLEPIESAGQTPVPSISPELAELLSNLALRLTKVEAELKPKEADEVADDRPTQPASVDNVNSPQHYRHGRFETIELIEDITKKYDDGFVAYCVGNAVKYVDRAPFKHGSPSEDLRKAAWYLTRAAEHMDSK